MKRLSLAILLFLSGYLQAATNITTPTVSGHWTLAGSPYLIFNNIEIATPDALIIDDGVDVIFQGSYYVLVSGSLRAKGTATKPITFKINDTTGWSDQTSSNGGWHGIAFAQYVGSTPDISAFRYCIVQDTKFDMSYFLTGGATTMSTDRNLKISNCAFHHNYATPDIPWRIIKLLTYRANDTVQMDSCAIYDNNCVTATINIYSDSGGYVLLRNNKIYDNSATYVVSSASTSFIFEGNDVHHNRGEAFSCAGGKGIVRRNRFYENKGDLCGAINISGGRYTIENNLICNNEQLAVACGIIDGGAGISVSCNTGIDCDSTFFIIRNNVLANNLSHFQGGAIKVYMTHSVITNNHIFNNSAPIGAAICFSIHAEKQVVQNNIFKGNLSASSIFPGPIGGFYDTSTLMISHNWCDTFLSADTTNMTGTDPGVAAPTLTPIITESALTANFSLTASSPCINKGSVSGITIATDDLQGRSRVVGGQIDIGAFEFNPAAIGVPPIEPNESTWMCVFPNPAKTAINIATSAAGGQLILFDVTGCQLLSSILTERNQSLELNDIPPGVYLLKWKKEEVQITKRIVVE